MSALAKFLLLRPKGVNLIAFLRSIDRYFGVPPMQELTGLVARFDNVAVPLGRELVREGDFPNDPGVWTLVSNWSIAGGKCLYDDLGTGYFRQEMPVEASKTYVASFVVSDLAAGTARIQITDFAASVALVPEDDYANGSYSIPFTSSVTSTGFRFYGNVNSIGTFSVTGVSIKQADIADSSAGLGLLDGTYNAAVSLDADGAGNIPRFAAFNGSAVLDLLSAEHNSALDPKSFEVIALLDNFTWDATKRVILNIYVDANNYFTIYASTTPGELVWEYMEAGALSSVTLATGSPSGLFSVGLGVESDVMQAVYKGVQTGADQALAGTFVGNYTIMSAGASDLVPNDGAIASIAYAPTEFTGLLSAATRLQIDAAFGVS